MYSAVMPESVLLNPSANGGREEQRSGGVVTGRMQPEAQHLDDTEGILREDADGEHGRTDHHAGEGRLGRHVDGEGDDDEERADRIVGDGVQPRREELDQGHRSDSLSCVGNTRSTQPHRSRDE